MSAARFFVEQGAKVTVTDMKTARELGQTVHILKKLSIINSQLSIIFHLGGHRIEDIHSADLIIRNPGVPSNSPYLAEARKLKIPIMTDVSVFMQLAPCSIYGVTGTRGKSTTTALLGEMFREMNPKTFVGGNIQRSPLTFLNQLDADSIVVLELSSWLCESLADIKESPHGAIVTNIYPDHLNVHGTMREYVRAKENIFKFQKSGDILVLNRDNPFTRRMTLGTIRANPVAVPMVRYGASRRMVGQEVLRFSTKPFSKENGSFARGEKIIYRFDSEEEIICNVSDLALLGEHNLANALGAVALARRAGVSAVSIKKVLREFGGLPNRQEIIRLHQGVTWVNDTTSTTPEATIAALQRFSQNHKITKSQKNIILIAGGADKKLKFNELAKEIKRHCKAVILLSGTATPKLQKLLPSTFYLLPTSKSMREALAEVRKIAERDDIVLLSPGAASFGLFKNEFDRGEQFVSLVNKLR